MAFTQSRSSIRALATARAISITGGAAAFIALQFTIAERTNSPFLVGLTLVGTFGVATILQGPAGALGDRFDRKKVMIASDLVAGVLFLLLAFVDAVPAMMVIAFFAAVAEAPMWAISGAAIPAMVGDESQRSWANSLVNMGVHFGIFLGPLIGGALLSLLGPSGVFALNAFSFGLSALLVYLVRRPFREDVAGEDGPTGVLAGVGFIARDRILRIIAVGWFLFVLGIGLQIAADPFLIRVFAADPIVEGIGLQLGLGALVAAWGLGSVTGSGLGRFLKRPSEGPALVFGTLIVSATSIAAGLAPWFAFLLVLLFLNGLADSLGMVAETNIAQRRAPESVRARVMGSMLALPGIAFVVSFLVAGLVVDLVGPRGSYVVAGALEVLAAAVMFPVLARLRTESPEDIAAEEAVILQEEPELPVV